MNDESMNEVSLLLCVREAKGQTAQEADSGWPETTSGVTGYAPGQMLTRHAHDLATTAHWSCSPQWRGDREDERDLTSPLYYPALGRAWLIRPRVAHKNAENGGCRAVYAETVSQDWPPGEMAPTS